jgi:hypothetical protein
VILYALAACQGPGDETGPADTEVETVSGDTGYPSWEPDPLEPDVVVDCAGGADFTTIHDAIAASPSGTKIGLAPCTYEEDVDFRGKALNIFGIEGSASTTILGSGGGAAIRATHGEALGTRLAGVTVSGGATDGYYGSGLFMDLATLKLEDVVFTGNDVGSSVMYANGAFLEMTDVTYGPNRVDAGGGVQVLTNGSAVYQRVHIACTDADYAIYQHNALLILDSDIACGTDHAIYDQGNGVHVRRSRVESPGIALLAGDSDDTRNERVWMFNSAFIGGDTGVSTLFMHVKAENDVFWGGRIGLDLEYDETTSYVRSSAAYGSECGIAAAATDDYADVGWNAMGTQSGCFQGHDAVLTDDPQFAAAPDDFALQGSSPLIDAGNPDDQDPDNSPTDIGIYGGSEGAGQR